MEKYGKSTQKDHDLLKELQENSKQTTAELSKKLNLPMTTVHNRIKRLEKKGVIKGYSIVLDKEKIGKSIKSYVLASVNHMLSSGIKVSQDEVAREIKDISGVESVEVLTGSKDLLVKIRVQDVKDLNYVVVKKLRKIDGVDKTQTMIVLNEF